jgi:hypothetical protein
VSAVLVAVLRPEEAELEDFYTWYETEHVAGRLAMPGFLGAHRYVSDADPHLGLLIYELDGLDALATERYLSLQAATSATTQTRMGRLRQFVRVTGRVILEHGDLHGPAPSLLLEAFRVPQSEAEDFDSWFREERAPWLIEAQGWQRVQLVQVAESNMPWSRLVLHRGTGLSAVDSPRLRDTTRTPGRRDVAARSSHDPTMCYTATAVNHLNRASGQ